jgi:hypothetical protein
MTDTPPPAPSPLDAVPDMRASAKWILGAAAASGAALLGGGPLAAVGKVHTAGAAITACTGLLIGLLGIGWAIWFTADALIPPLTTPKTLDTDPRLQDLRDRIASDPAAFYGPFGGSMADLGKASELHSKAAASLVRALATETDATRQKVLAAAIEEARATTAAVQRRTRTLLELAHAWDVRAKLRTARLQAFAGAAIAAVGVVMFVAAAKPVTATTNTPGRSPSAPAASASP